MVSGRNVGFRSRFSAWPCIVCSSASGCPRMQLPDADIEPSKLLTSVIGTQPSSAFSNVAEDALSSPEVIEAALRRCPSLPPHVVSPRVCVCVCIYLFVCNA